jgi:hypothetical protein
MRVRISDGGRASELVAFFRARDFLAVKRSRTLLEVSPLVTLSDGADRGRVVRVLDEWEAANPEAAADLLRD